MYQQKYRKKGNFIIHCKVATSVFRARENENVLALHSVLGPRPSSITEKGASVNFIRNEAEWPVLV